MFVSRIPSEKQTCPRHLPCYCEVRAQETIRMDKHGKPAPGMECACCYDDIESENYVEYRSDKGERFCRSTSTAISWRSFDVLQVGV